MERILTHTRNMEIMKMETMKENEEDLMPFNECQSNREINSMGRKGKGGRTGRGRGGVGSNARHYHGGWFLDL